MLSHWHAWNRKDAQCLLQCHQARCSVRCGFYSMQQSCTSFFWHRKGVSIKVSAPTAYLYRDIYALFAGAGFMVVLRHCCQLTSVKGLATGKTWSHLDLLLSTALFMATFWFRSSFQFRTGDRWASFKLKEWRFRLGVRKEFFTVGVVTHWNRLPRGAVYSLSLEMLEDRLDGSSRNLG